MEKLVKEVKEIINFKDDIDIGDIVLIMAKEPQMIVYALVNEIEPDKSRRDEWWHVSFTLLTVPPQEIKWTLRTEQMTGQEIFTMGGDDRFVKPVDFGSVKLTTVPFPEIKKPKTKKPFLKRIK